MALKFSRHGPVFHEDLDNRVAYAVRSVVQEPGTAAYKGSFQLAQAESCADFFERAMHWLVPTHSLICGDVDGNIALQVTGLTPDRDGWNGRLPVPGNGDYEWRGFRTDLPREFNPERGYVATANNNVHPPGYEGRPVFYHSSRGGETSRIARLHQILGTGELLSVDDHKRIQHDARLLAAERDIAAFRGWKSDDPDVEWARGLIAEWDATVSRDSIAGALYVRWNSAVDAAARDPETPAAGRPPSSSRAYPRLSSGSPRNSVPTAPSGGTVGYTPANCRTCSRRPSTCHPWSVPAASARSTPPGPTSGASSTSRTRTARSPATPPGSRPNREARSTAIWPRTWATASTSRSCTRVERWRNEPRIG